MKQIIVQPCANGFLIKSYDDHTATEPTEIHAAHKTKEAQSILSGLLCMLKHQDNED